MKITKLLFDTDTEFRLGKYLYKKPRIECMAISWSYVRQTFDFFGKKSDYTPFFHFAFFKKMQFLSFASIS